MFLVTSHNLKIRFIDKFVRLSRLITIFIVVCIAQFTNANTGQYQTATLAGGCFWCTEADMEKVDGVIDVVSGYAGGITENPTYEDVSSGDTGHIETISVTFDPNVISFKAILDEFLRGIDPTDGIGSFVDRGNQYRPAIFYHDETQKQIAEQFLAETEAAQIFPKLLKVELIPFTQFWEAEAYHQDFYKNNSLRYRYYRHASGRDQYLDEVFGEDRKTNPKTIEQLIIERNAIKDKQAVNEGQLPVPNNKNVEPENLPPNNSSVEENIAKYKRPSDEEIRKNLSELQYQVTQKDSTERPFDNPYWNNEEAGIYVDIISGEPLFSSTDKYDSGTGWPSFTKPIDDNFITTKEDNTWFSKRTEVRSRYADSHLGHVFDDGPAPTGLRYCMNSASMRFIPKAELAGNGYGKYLVLFEPSTK